MAYLAEERAKEKNWNQRIGQYLRIVKLLCGLTISVAIFPGFIILGDEFSSSKEQLIPVVKSPTEPWRQEPSDPGGLVAENLGLRINALFVGRRDKNVASYSTIPKESVALQPGDISKREYATRPIHADYSQLLEGVLFKNGESPPDTIETDVSAQEGYSVSQEIGSVTLSHGQIHADFGNFPSRDAAENQQVRLMILYGQHLEGLELSVRSTDNGGEDLFHLRVAGFSNLEGATDFCGRLNTDGENCSPVVAN